jgi:hypothetical protein
MVRSSKITSLFLATVVLFGLLSFGSTNAFRSINPTRAEIAEAKKSNQGRSIQGPEAVLTNAQRFQRGLPPAPPAINPREPLTF